MSLGGSSEQKESGIASNSGALLPENDEENSSTRTLEVIVTEENEEEKATPSAVLEMRKEHHKPPKGSSLRDSMKHLHALEEEKQYSRRQFKYFLEGRNLKINRCPSDDVVTTEMNRSSDEENDSVGQEYHV